MCVHDMCAHLCVYVCAFVCVCTRMRVRAYVCAEVVTYIQITNVQLNCSFVFYTIACIHIHTCIY